MRSVLNTKRVCGKHIWYISGILFFSTPAMMAEAQTEQRKNLVGVSTALQWTSGFGAGPVFGLSYERRFSTHSSFETGIRYRGYDFYNRRPGGGWRYYSQTYSFFSLPLLYKYSSSVINIAAGPTLNLLNRKSQPDTIFNPLQKKTGRVVLGYQVKVGKTMDLTDRLMLEPEVSVLGDQYFSKPKAEVNVGFKYRF